MGTRAPLPKKKAAPRSPRERPCKRCADTATSFSQRGECCWGWLQKKTLAIPANPAIPAEIPPPSYQMMTKVYNHTVSHCCALNPALLGSPVKMAKYEKSFTNSAPVLSPRSTPDILSPWRQLLSLPIPCHVHWPRSYCRSRARTAAICRKPCFRGRPACTRGIRARPVPACRVRSCGVGGRRESERRPGYREAVPGTAGRQRPLVACVTACCLRRAVLGGGSRAGLGEWWAGRRSVFPWCGVGHAWLLGLVRRPVTLSGMLLWWTSGAFVMLHRERVD
jgi:hypothetical protein